MNIALQCLMASIWRMCLCFSYYLGLCLSSSLSCISHQIVMFCYSPLCLFQGTGEGLCELSAHAREGSLWIWIWFKRPMTKYWRWGETIVMGLKKTTTLSSHLTKYDFHLDTFGLIPKYGIDFFFFFFKVSKKADSTAFKDLYYLLFDTYWLHHRITDLGFDVLFISLEYSLLTTYWQIVNLRNMTETQERYDY